MSQRRTARCACGKVEIEVAGAPIASVACHCDDCQAGSAAIEALPGAAPVRDAFGGTAYVLCRPDRIGVLKGAELLKPIKLRQASATNRVVASCCNSAMLMRFDDMRFWVPVYRDRLLPDAPPLEMRIATKFMPAGVSPPGDVPASPSYPLGFAIRLVGARIAMVFGRRPD